MKRRLSAMRLTVLAGTVLVCLVAAGFASGSEVKRDATSPAFLKAAKAAVAKAKAAPRILGPKQAITVPTGKTIGIIPCGLTAPACVRMADQVKAAAKVLGWKTVTADGALSPQGF